jgi:DGQHR domain-containing protein
MYIHMKVKAFRIRQRNTDLYIAVLPAIELLGRAKVDVWSPVTSKGYQRDISPTRAMKAGRYLIEKEGIFPQSVVLNVREAVHFKVEQDTGSGQYGELEIPNDAVLWEVDGQHRLQGLSYAIERNPEFSKYPVNITLLNLHDEFDEMKQFYIINTEMKGVRSDLAERLISEMVAREGEQHYKRLGKSRELFIARANKIVDQLNVMKGQPWFAAIQLPNEEKKSNHLIAQRSFVTSLKPVLRVTEGVEAQIVAKMLVNYWQAIKKRYPKAFDRPQDYLIQRTLGVFVFHMLFPRIKALCGNNMNVENIKRWLDKVEGDDEAWSKAGAYKPYGGMKGFNYLAAELETFLYGETPEIKL